MTKLQWLFGKRYELSGDDAGLLRYVSQHNYYHVHNNEMTSKEKRWHRILTRLKGEVRFA